MSTEIDQPPQAPLVAETDWFLQSLVRMANDASLQVAITVQVSGMLVSGYLVSGKQYFEEFAAEFAGAFSTHPELAESIRTSFRSYGDIYGTQEEEAETPPPQFLHLKDARFFNTAGNPIPGNRGVWWRGRICEVGGFSLGVLSANAG